MQNIKSFNARVQHEKARLNVQFQDRFMRTLHWMLKNSQREKERAQAMMEANAGDAKGCQSNVAYKLARLSFAMDLHRLKAHLVRMFRNSFDKDVVNPNFSTTPPKPPTCNVYHYPHPSTSSEAPAAE